MLRALRVLALVCCLALVASPIPAVADHNEDDHTANMELLANRPRAEAELTQSDLAFWGDLAVAGNYGGFRLLNISNPATPKMLADVFCPASQNDVSIWKNLVVTSIDRGVHSPKCNLLAGSWEGIRLFDISNRQIPKLIKGVRTDCGSHTHTLVPGPKSRGRVRVLYLYISSYSSCPVDAYTKISVVKVPLAHPERAKVIGQPDVSPAPGCHDITVFMELKIAAAACQNEGQIWDISDRAKPKVVSHITNPAIDFWHSATFTWDGRYVVFGDEFRGGTQPGCPAPSTPVGAAWIYEVADPVTPLGRWSLPRSQAADACTVHNFNFIPIPDRYLLVAASYAGGTSVVDFTDPALPNEIGYYDAADPAADTWSSYFYNGYIYANDIQRGVDVFRFVDPASTEATRLPFFNPQTQMKVLFEAN